jgi:hypothetical protein
MTALDVMALFSLAMMVVIGILIFVGLASLPGSIAKKRGHPNATAIQIGGWATLIFAMVGWPFVLMWALMGEANSSAETVNASKGTGGDGLNPQIRELEQRIAALENNLKKEEG